MQYIIEMKNITKYYGATVANDRVNLFIKGGEIHAILGENGAGKSTLMRILYGEEKADSGEIFIKGNKILNHNTRISMTYGLGMVHQNFVLVPEFSILENFNLGNEPTKIGIFCNYKSTKERAETILSQLDVNLPLNKPVKNFSVEDKQIIEIAKLLYRGADLLILDEPTSVLSPTRIDLLLKILEKLRGDGKTIILITHKLSEVFRVVDKITVLRKGRVVANFDRVYVNQNDVVEAMVGQETNLSITKSGQKLGKTILQIENVSLIGENKKVVLDNISLDVREGEIFGIIGVGGNGQRELVEAIIGLRSINKGQIYMNNTKINHLDVFQRRRLGMVYVPEDRSIVGSEGDLSLTENAIIGHHVLPPIFSKGLIKSKTAQDFAEYLIEKYGIVANSALDLAKSLSGGNLQKLIIGRELSFESKLIIMEYPTQGIDIRTTSYVYQTLLSLRTEMYAILLISGDLDEVLSLSDRLAVMFRGKLSKILKPSETNRFQIGKLMVAAEN